MQNVRFRYGAVLLIVFTAIFAWPNRASDSQANSGDAVKQADIDFCRAVQQRGVEGWMSFFKDSAVVGGPSDPPLKGKDEIRGFFTKVFARENLDFQWVPIAGEIFPAGNLGYTSGRAHQSYTENGVRRERTSRYVTVWQKQSDNTWRVIADFGAPDPTPSGVPVSCK